MTTGLRDLEADRRTAELYREAAPVVANIALAALDEIERLKGLMVVPAGGGYMVVIDMPDQSWFREKADAWAAVRKAACK